MKVYLPQVIFSASVFIQLLSKNTFTEVVNVNFILQKAILKVVTGNCSASHNDYEKSREKLSSPTVVDLKYFSQSAVIADILPEHKSQLSQAAGTLKNRLVSDNDCQYLSKTGMRLSGRSSAISFCLDAR